jgi:hypothetical protein
MQWSFHRYSFIPTSVGAARFLKPIAWQRDNASILRIDFAESATDHRSGIVIGLLQKALRFNPAKCAVGRIQPRRQPTLGVNPIGTSASRYH